MIGADRPGQPILNLNVNNALATNLFTRRFLGEKEKSLLQELGVVATGFVIIRQLHRISYATEKKCFVLTIYDVFNFLLGSEILR